MSCSHVLRFGDQEICLDKYYVERTWPWPPIDDPRRRPAIELIDVVLGPHPDPWREKIVDLLDEISGPFPEPWDEALSGVPIHGLEVQEFGSDLQRLVKIAETVRQIQSPELRARLGDALQGGAEQFAGEFAPGATLTLTTGLRAD